jgi:hypothetical protein
MDEKVKICRICEHTITIDKMASHSNICAIEQDFVSQNEKCNAQIRLLYEELKKSEYERQGYEKSGYSLSNDDYKLAIDLQRLFGSVLAKLKSASKMDHIHEAGIKLMKLEKYCAKIDKKIVQLKVTHPSYDVKTLNQALAQLHRKKLVYKNYQDKIDKLPISILKDSEEGRPKKDYYEKGFNSIFWWIISGQKNESNSKSKHPISIDDFGMIKQISKGAYGKVFLAQKTSTKDLFAVKVLKKEDMIKKNMVSQVLAERQVLGLLDNPYVVKLYYAFHSKQHLYLVMEYLIGGDLRSLLDSWGVFPPDFCRMYAAEVILALEYLHKNQIIHRDLKPDNMLVDSQGHLKLTVFVLKIGFWAF